MHINHDALQAFTASLDLTVPDHDPSHVPIGDDESTASFVMVLDAVNFGSGYFPYLAKREGMSGYHTIAASVRDHIVEHGPPTSDWLRNVTTAETAAIFG